MNEGIAMKINSIIAYALGLAATCALAQEPALITKTNSTGFTMPEYARSETCEVFQNKVVITTRFGAFDENSVTNQEVRRIQLSASIYNVLKKAAAEPLTSSDNYLCDGPSTSINSRHSGKSTVLFTTGGCGSPRLDRSGASARILIDLVSSYCPVTHDFGVQNTTLDN